MLEAYDHLLSGWWRSVERYRRAGGPPTVVMVCADEAEALACVALADELLTACLAVIGVAPEQWQRPGRCGLYFVAEEDLHRGQATAWRVPVLPPALRNASLCEPLRADFVQLPPSDQGSAAKPPWR